MGFFAKLFGLEDGSSSERTVEAGQPCAKCGEPVPKENMGFDSGSGRPIHVTCPRGGESSDSE